MLLYLLAFVGGILTIVSPCILPVLPFVFSRADQPFRRSGLPLLAGMAITFALVAAVATAAGALGGSRKSDRQNPGDGDFRRPWAGASLPRHRRIFVPAVCAAGRARSGQRQ